MRHTGYLILIIMGIILLPAAAAAAPAAPLDEILPDEILRGYLVDNYPWEEIQLSGLRLSARFPDGMPEKIPEKIIVRRGPPGRTVFHLQFKGGESITATANVKAFDRVVMSRRPFRKGHCFVAEDIYTALMDIRRIPGGAIKGLESAEGKTLTRSVVANRPILEGMVSGSALLKRGHKVILVVQSPGFSITMLGELKQDAYVGNHVRVVNTASKKVLSGLLVDESTVVLRF